MLAFQSYLLQAGRFALLSLLPVAALELWFVLRPQNRRPERRARLRWLITLWYLSAILIGTLFARWNSRHAPFTGASFRLFGALRDALATMDGHAWNLLILNILVFVPLGLLLVWHAQARGRRVYWTILLLPLGIELLQLCTGLGFFELDDVLLNALGGAWGLCLGECYVNRKQRKLRWLLPLALLPFILLAAVILRLLR